MTEGMKTIIYPVKDLARAKAIFGGLLGVAPQVDTPHYVGFGVDGQHVGLDPNGHASGSTGPIAFWHVDDIRATLKALLDAGAELQQDVREVGGGRVVATAKDPDGNVIGLLQDPSSK